MGKFSALEAAELTNSWTMEERSALAHFLEKKEFIQGATIFHKSSETRALYIIDSGSVRMSHENIFLELNEGESFGEISLLHATPKTTAAVATKDTVLWILSYENWNQLRRASPAVSLKLAESISKKLVGLIGKAMPPTKWWAHRN